MAWFDCFWYEENLRHLAENGVTPDEFEEVVTGATDFDVSSSGSDMAQGTTSAGRFLVCLFVMLDDLSVLPITAYEPTKGNE
jgi:hypothetical protein